jgi:F0F1-type ATP synthase assembly protein I
VTKLDSEPGTEVTGHWVRFAKMPTKPDKSLIWLGKYLSLALTLPASVVAGYILGAIGDHFLHIPFLRVLGIIIGMTAGIVQIIRELSREAKK